MHSNYGVKWLSMYMWISGYELLEIVTVCWICLSTLYTDECDASGQSYIMVHGRNVADACKFMDGCVKR